MSQLQQHQQQQATILGDDAAAACAQSTPPGFVAQLAQGRVPAASLDAWLRWDHVYLCDCAKLCASMASLAPRIDLQPCSELLAGVERELEWIETQLAMRGLTPLVDPRTHIGLGVTPLVLGVPPAPVAALCDAMRTLVAAPSQSAIDVRRAYARGLVALWAQEQCFADAWAWCNAAHGSEARTSMLPLVERWTRPEYHASIARLHMLAERALHDYGRDARLDTDQLRREALAVVDWMRALEYAFWECSGVPNAAPAMAKAGMTAMTAAEAQPVISEE